MPVIGSPANAIMMSPSRSPASLAGLFGSTEAISTPEDTARLFAAGDEPRNRDVLAATPHEAAADAAVAHQAHGDELRRVAAIAKQSPERENHRGVDADDFAARRHQRPAGVAGIERGVGLDDVVHQPAGSRAQRSSEALTTPAVTEW